MLLIDMVNKMTSRKGITNIDIEKYFENETNNDLKKTLWVFIHRIQ